ncbi:hypothetical protein [Phaeovulum vinaykumarii]|uniref:Uncharacterized protein n=1 Tax=Phaeovulum vinaykumarii TaxID=407234 RepID=A0A1N7MEQ0_9RHOB|nr:hypothetical protein [Phaeovulum vinaykumarii]SIS84538.1 hypothetical protein SAMN05421795_10728 [Phaeovulum vinaykumarii]SOC11821.1 hypothetical protein SAMN05878426_10728 [Phaeovulum vinaykumarii]
MTKIKFIAARFADPDENELALKRRFERHLRKPRAFQDGVSPKMPGDFEDELRWNEDLIAVHLSEKDRTKVLRRARRVMRARAEVSGLSHLSADDRRALEVFRGGADLVGIASDHRADEIATAIHAEMPWVVAATDLPWKAMRRSVCGWGSPDTPYPSRGRARLSPIAPGAGKRSPRDGQRSMGKRPVGLQETQPYPDDWNGGSRPPFEKRARNGDLELLIAIPALPTAGRNMARPTIRRCSANVAS